MYNLDLNDLPLDRLSEQKSKKRRGVGSRAASTGSVQPPRKGSVDQENNTAPKESVVGMYRSLFFFCDCDTGLTKKLLELDHPLRDMRKVRPLPRSASDNNIYNVKTRAKLHRQRTHTIHSGIPGK